LKPVSCLYRAEMVHVFVCMYVHVYMCVFVC
jgi:hypothetical protein